MPLVERCGSRADRRAFVESHSIAKELSCMQKFLAAAIGFFSLTPGLSVFSVRGVGVQPLVILLLVYAVLVPARNGRMRIQSLIWLSVTLASSVMSTIFS